MEKTEPLFLIHMVNGYTFRNVMKIIKSEVVSTSMILSQKLVEISFVNSTRSAVHRILIYPDECTDWRYNIRDEEGELFKEFPIGFNTDEFYNTTKKIGRRDGIRIFLLPGEDKITIQPIKGGAKDIGTMEFLFVSMVQIQHNRAAVGNYNDEPNVKISPNNFAEMCSTVNSMQCKQLEISGQINSVQFKGIHGNKSAPYFRTFGTPTTMNFTTPLASNMNEITDILKNYSLTQNEIVSSGLTLNIVDASLVCISVPISTINALSKIDNISPNGSLLRFYFEKCQPIKLESAIGTYGTYTILFKDTKDGKNV